MFRYWKAPHKGFPIVGVTSVLLTVVLVSCQPPISRSSSASGATEPLCHFPDFLQTRKGRTHWMINQSNSRTSFDVIGGRIFARSGTCAKTGAKTRHRQSAGPECRQSNYTWVCWEQQAEKKYLVQHLESTFVMYVCVEFLQRNVSVVQLRMSPVERSLQSLCDEQYMFIDPWPWISYEHFRSPPVACPITGGFNLQLKYASPTGPQRPTHSRYHSGLYSSSQLSSSPSEPYSCVDASTAPMRLESDCVRGEGVFFDFRHESCLPPGSKLMVHQRALCMASWRQENEDFAVLRSANNDRAIWCLRVSWQNDQVHEIVLFLDWVCPTSSYTDLSRQYSPKHSPASPHLTPHLTFDVRSRQVITEPCSDQLSTCHAHAGFCSGFQCMSTCGKCSPASDGSKHASGGELGEESSPVGAEKKATIVLTNSREAVHFPQQVNVGEDDVYSAGSHSDNNNNNNNDDENLDDEDSGTNAEDEVDGTDDPDADVTAQNQPSRTFQRGCTFPENVRGTWLHRTTEGEERLVITESTLRHPRLGELHCITFLSPHSELVSLRRVLWRRYNNGCYPRFTCLHFSTPSRSVMRYRLANEQHWPLELSDEAICDERHFLEPPDIFHPADKYVSRSWEVARRGGPIQNMPCILPHHVPRVVSFLDDQDRSGCMVHGTYYSPRTIVLTYFPKTERGGDTTPSPPHTPGFGQTQPDNPDVRRTQDHEFPETSSKNDRPGIPGNDFKNTPFKNNNSGTDGNDLKETPLGNDHSRTDGFYVERNDSRDKSVDSAIPEDTHFDHDYRQLYIDQDDDENDLLEAARESKMFARQPGEISDTRNRYSNRPGQYPTDARNVQNRETLSLSRQNSGDSRGTSSPSRQILGSSRQTPVSSRQTLGSTREAASFGRQAADSGREISDPGMDLRGGHRSSDDGRGTFVFKKYEYSYSNTDRPVQSRYYFKSRATENDKRPLGNNVHAGNRPSSEAYDGIYANDDSNVYHGRGSDTPPGSVLQRKVGPTWVKAVNNSAARYRVGREGAPSASTKDDVVQQAPRQRREVSGADDVVQTSYECLAVMTYADTYKSVLTVTSDKPDEILCWLVVNQYTVVILNTSSCNSQTAERVLNPARYPSYKLHKHAILRLHSGERDCDAIRPADRVWPEPVKYQDTNVKSAGSPGVRGWVHLNTVVISFSVIRAFQQW